METTVPAPARAVWAALTEPERLVHWLGDVDGDLRLGGTFRAQFHASGWEGTGWVEVCDEPHRLRLQTKGTGDEGEGPLELTLTESDERTLVTWEERGMPLAYLAAYGAGIQIHVEDLTEYLAGGRRRDSAPRFDPLYAAYQQVDVLAG